MKLDLQESWSVRLDVTVNETTLGVPCRAWSRHANIIVYAPTVERALAVVREDFPGSRIWAINHAHKDAIVCVESMPATLPNGAAHEQEKKT